MRSVEYINPRTGDPILKATFELVGDAVEAVWHDSQYRDEIEDGGIYTAGTGRVRPRDGARFYEALPIAYANSSLVRVT